MNSKEFFAQIKKLVTAGNIDRAIKLCDAGDYPTLQLVKAGLTHANKGPDEIDAAMSEKIGELKPAVEKRVGSLWSLANIATLIGLLGTVIGLITRSAPSPPRGSRAADTSAHPRDGISEAMYNTAFGLGIAVTCMIAHLILAPALEEHPARPRRDAGARLQPAHHPDAARGAGYRSDRTGDGGESEWRRTEKLSAAQRSKIRRLSAPKELAPDEEGGELNIVPFLDIITNVLMFVLATVSVTFTATIDIVSAEAQAGASARAPTTPTLASTVIVVPEGFSVKASGGNVAPGCHDTGSGIAVREDERRLRLRGAEPLRRQAEAAVARTFATRRSVTISANPNIPYQVDHQHDRRRPQGSERATELFPDVNFGLAR